MKVLTVEDDTQIVEAIKLFIQLRWPTAEISSVSSGNEATELLENNAFDIVLLDVNLPDISGFEVLKQIRLFSDVPILILTVRDSEDDIVWGLENGADDYVVKPFKPRDLAARISAIIRRVESKRSAEGVSTIALGKLSLNYRSNKVSIGEDFSNLTPIESELLYTLMHNAGKTISMDQIWEEVWAGTESNSALVRTYIKRLRDKLKDHPPRIILNERGGGYRLVEPV